MLNTSAASGIGLATISGQTVLDVWYPQPGLTALPQNPADLSTAIDHDQIRDVRVETVVTVIDDLSQPPVDTAGCLLTPALVVPPAGDPAVHQPGRGLRPVAQRGVDDRRAGGPGRTGHHQNARRSHRQHITVLSVDKFPRMVDYVVPSGVRIADGDRVRLGAHLASGTTVMQGVLQFQRRHPRRIHGRGPHLCRGRGRDGTDVGGGASIMGTLSGGGSEVITIGQGCLIGANAGWASRWVTDASWRRAAT